MRSKTSGGNLTVADESDGSIAQFELEPIVVAQPAKQCGRLLAYRRVGVKPHQCALQP
jgi:hypothetical protein